MKNKILFIVGQQIFINYEVLKNLHFFIFQNLKIKRKFYDELFYL